MELIGRKRTLASQFVRKYDVEKVRTLEKNWCVAQDEDEIRHRKEGRKPFRAVKDSSAFGFSMICQKLFKSLTIGQHHYQ